MPLSEDPLIELDEFDSFMRKKISKYRRMVSLLRDAFENLDVSDSQSVKLKEAYLKLIKLTEQEIEDQENEHHEWLKKRVASKRGILHGLKARLQKDRECLNVETDEDLINALLNMAEERITNLSNKEEI